MNNLTRIFTTVLVAAGTWITTAVADITPGTDLEGRLQAEFTGVITEVIVHNRKSGFIAEVEFDGNFASGMPFTGVGEVLIRTNAPIAVGDDVQGTMRANAEGEITQRDINDIRFEAEGEIFRGGWITRTQFGGASKGGGTNVFRLEGTLSISGSSGGNDI